MRRTERTVQEGNIESAIQRVTEVHGHPTARFSQCGTRFHCTRQLLQSRAAHAGDMKPCIFPMTPTVASTCLLIARFAVSESSCTSIPAALASTTHLE